MAERKAVIKNADMSEDMQQDAVDCASQALEKYNIEKVRKINRLISLQLSLVIRILLPILRRSLTRSITPLGTA